MMLFEAVTADAHKTLKDLMDALTAIKRNDVKNIITDVYPGLLKLVVCFSMKVYHYVHYLLTNTT